jgi:hypothetical protein
MTQEDSSTLFDAYPATRIQAQANNHVTGTLYFDALQGDKAGQLFESSCANTSLSADQTAAGLRQVLQAVYPPRPQGQTS